nr:MAG TPA: hypothetical protein [Caudoviricetes sp.]
MVFLLHLILKIPKYLLFSDKKNISYKKKTDVIGQIQI